MNIRPDPFGALREREPSKIIIFYARPKFHDFSTLGRARSSKTRARLPFSFEDGKKYMYISKLLPHNSGLELRLSVVLLRPFQMLRVNLTNNHHVAGYEILAVINANDLV